MHAISQKPSFLQTFPILSPHSLEEQPASPPTPWMPLEGLVEQWAAFATATTSACATKAISHAFAAVSEERTALHHSACACQEQRRRAPTKISWGQALHEQQCAIDALTQAASSWMEAVSVLEYSLAEGDFSPETISEQGIRVLISSALAQRVRICCIAEHLVREHLLWYQLVYEDTMQGCDAQWKERGTR